MGAQKRAYAKHALLVGPERDAVARSSRYRTWPHAFRCFGDGRLFERLHRQRGDRFISESKALQFYNSARKACLLACRCRTKTLTRSR